MEYTEKDLVKVAKRENNTKRNYLVVDPKDSIKVASDKVRFKEIKEKASLLKRTVIRNKENRQET